MNQHNDHGVKFGAWLASEISERMVENLPFIKFSPKKILLWKPKSIALVKDLHNFYPKTRIFSNASIATTILDALKVLLPFQNSSKYQLLDEKNGQEIDLVWACPWEASLQNEIEHEMVLWRNMMSKESLLMFAYLGPDTAKEYRGLHLGEVFSGLDMHDVGDALVRNGFADPVMHMEYITLQYQETSTLIRDLNVLKVVNSNKIDENQYIKEFLQPLRSPDGGWTLTLELVYGHAWRVEKRDARIAAIHPESIKVKKRQNSMD